MRDVHDHTIPSPDNPHHSSPPPSNAGLQCPLIRDCTALGAFATQLSTARIGDPGTPFSLAQSLATGPIDVNDVALSDFSCAHVDPTGDLTTPMDLVLRQGHARLSTQEPLQACQILPLTKDAPHVSCRSCVEANTQWTRVLNATLRATSIGDVETAACTARLASLADSATAATGGHVWICAPEVLRARVAAHSIHPSDPPSNYPTTTMAATCKGIIHRSRQQGVVSVPVKSANVVAGPATAASMNWLSADIFRCVVTPSAGLCGCSYSCACFLPAAVQPRNRGVAAARRPRKSSVPTAYGGGGGGGRDSRPAPKPEQETHPSGVVCTVPCAGRGV